MALYLENTLRKILILGYFGYGNNQLDGQTVKTRDVRRLLQLKLSEGAVSYFDTQSLQANKFNYIKLLFLLVMSKDLVYLPGKNNLLGLAFIIDFLIKFKKLNVYYLVVGGWIELFLQQNPKLITLLKKFKFIGVEIPSLADRLRNEYNLTQADFFPNFRLNNFKPEIRNKNEGLKLVFMARIMMEKGLSLIFEVAEQFEKDNVDIKIDFYGPISDADNEYFLNKVNLLSSVRYFGVLEPEEISSTINDYDALILPTKYDGEGFPGSILDAYISGVPVIVSNWKFLPEFVEEGKTGFIINNKGEFLDRVKYLYCNKKILLDMKASSHEKSKSFSSDSAWAVLSKYL